ncbi:MAG: hypothetical protein NTU57_01910 [Candidatus Aenigmarchaeota archaeon]|nr:hypothetical protein [Candidatus Aenigmarchaeota archaeon]
MTEEKQSSSKSALDKVGDLLENAAKVVKTRKTTAGALMAAVLGGMIKLTVLTETFPQPFDVVGNVIIFAAVLMVIIDLCRGGLED